MTVMMQIVQQTLGKNDSLLDRAEIGMEIDRARLHYCLAEHDYGVDPYLEEQVLAICDESHPKGTFGKSFLITDRTLSARDDNALSKTKRVAMPFATFDCITRAVSRRLMGVEAGFEINVSYGDGSLQQHYPRFSSRTYGPKLLEMLNMVLSLPPEARRGHRPPRKKSEVDPVGLSASLAPLEDPRVLLLARLLAHAVGTGAIDDKTAEGLAWRIEMAEWLRTDGRGKRGGAWLSLLTPVDLEAILPRLFGYGPSRVSTADDGLSQFDFPFAPGHPLNTGAGPALPGLRFETGKIRGLGVFRLHTRKGGAGTLPVTHVSSGRFVNVSRMLYRFEMQLLLLEILYGARGADALLSADPAAVVHEVQSRLGEPVDLSRFMG